MAKKDEERSGLTGGDLYLMFAIACCAVGFFEYLDKRGDETEKKREAELFEKLDERYARLAPESIEARDSKVKAN